MSGMILVKVYMAVVFFVQKLSFIIWIAGICKWELDSMVPKVQVFSTKILKNIYIWIKKKYQKINIKHLKLQSLNYFFNSIVSKKMRWHLWRLSNWSSAPYISWSVENRILCRENLVKWIARFLIQWCALHLSQTKSKSIPF